MKNILKYICVLTLSLLVTVSCRDEDKVRFPDFETGVNARVSVHPENLVLNFLDIANASLVFDIHSVNNDIDEITYTGTYTDASFPTQKFPTVEILKVPGSSFVNGVAANLELTAQELAEAFNLPGGADYLGGGDNFTFFASVKLKDGRIFDASNSAPSIAEGTNPSFTTQFKLYVSCPFSVDEAIGTYTIVTDPGEWATEVDHQVEIVAGPEPNQVILKDALGYPQKFDMVVDVDPVTGVATTTKQKTYDYDYWVPNSYGIGSTEGTGFFFSCSGFVTLDLKFTVAAGSWGIFKIEAAKN